MGAYPVHLVEEVAGKRAKTRISRQGEKVKRIREYRKKEFKQENM